MIKISNSIVILLFQLIIPINSFSGILFLKSFHKVSSLSMTSLLNIPTKVHNPLDDFDYINENKLPWMQNGYSTWNYDGHKVNYVDLGGGDNKPPLLLIHGFGASVYHWRYNIPFLARDFHVYAIDMLGFGLSGNFIMNFINIKLIFL